MKKIFWFLVIITICMTATQCKQASQQIQTLNDNSLANFPFERTIWTYWNSPNGQIPLIVQICFDNIEKVAKKHNFTFICVNESTVRQYIHNYDEEFIEVRKKSIQTTPAHAADLLRVILIEQQGGIWVDSTTLFVNGLGQLENIMSQKYAHMIANRFSPQPDALLFYYSKGQNRIQHYIKDPHNTSRKILYNQYPDYQIWMIAAKKNSTFMRDVRKTYQQWTTTQFNQVEKKFINEDIYMHRIDNFNNYLYLNMVVTYILQRKQQQLDQHTAIVGTRSTSFEYYKLWGLHSEYGPMLTTRQDLFPISDLLEYSTKDLEQKGFKFLFFMKQFGYFRYVMGYKLDLLIEIYERRNMTFEQFLSSKPDGTWCQNMTWLVEGSIMDEMINNSKASQKHQFPRITKQQNSQWQQYCLYNGSWFSLIKNAYHTFYIQTIVISMFMPDKIHKSKVHSILNEGKGLTFGQWLNVVYDDNAFLLVEFVYLLLIVGIMCKSYQWMFRLFDRHVRKQCVRENVEINEREMSDVNEVESQVNISSGKSTSPASKRTNSISYHFIEQKSLLYFLTFAILLSTLTLYNAVDILGGLDQPTTIFIFILCVFILQAYMQHQFSISGRKLIKFQKQYELFYIMINYMITYLALCHVRKNRFWLNWFSIVLGMVGPCVFKLKREISLHEKNNEAEKSQQQTSFLSFNQNKFKYMTILLLLIKITFPNIQYIAGPQGYYVKYIPTILTIFLAFIYIYVLIKCFNNKLYNQIVRLVFPVVICYYDTSYINQIQPIIHNHLRMMYIFLRVVVIGVIYQAMGSEIRYRVVEDVYFKKSKVKKIFVNFGMILFISLLGRLFFHGDMFMWKKLDFLQHWFVLMYGVFLMALFSHLQRIKTQKIRQSTQYTEVEIDNLSQ